MSPACAECVAVSKHTFFELAAVEEAPCRLRALSEVLIRSRTLSDTSSGIENVAPSGSKPTPLWSLCDSDDDNSSMCSTRSGAPSTAYSTSVASSHQSGKAERVSKESTKGADRVRAKAAKAARSGSEGALILRNLPETLTRSGLLAFLAARGHLTEVRFLYLPVDAATGKSLGYAFLSCGNAAAAETFQVRMQGAQLCAEQALQVSWNSTGGTVEDQVNRFRDSTLMHPTVSDELRPILLRDGVRVDFPAPTKKIRAPRQRDQLRLVARTRKQQAPK